MLKAIEKIRHLEINAICNGHGPILTKTWKRYVDLSEEYAKLAVALPEGNRVLIAYVSAYQNTEKMAEKLQKESRQSENIIADIHGILKKCL